ncbi:16075_t:CDS:2, partial [Dentiscutata erythropus]
SPASPKPHFPVSPPPLGSHISASSLYENSPNAFFHLSRDSAQKYQSPPPF